MAPFRGFTIRIKKKTALLVAAGAAAIAVIGVVLALVSSAGSSAPTSTVDTPTAGGITGTFDDWRNAVCTKVGSYRDGPAVGGFSFLNATAQAQCSSASGGKSTGYIAIGAFNSETDMRNDLVALRMWKYAATVGRSPIAVFAIQNNFAYNPDALDPLTQFGFSVTAV
jgi:hypothetical protein